MSTEAPKPKIIAIIGPTAIGKTSLSIELAKQYNGEIISVDSRQVYTGLDIGTGKVTREEMDDVPHFGLDIATPDKPMSVVEFKAYAEEKIREILKRGSTPILVGGTAHYMDAIVYNLSFPDVPENETLRNALREKSNEELFSLLQEKDPARAESIDSHNTRRLVRALEIVDALGSTPTQESKPLYDTLLVGLTAPRDILRERINIRVDTRLQEGMIEEVENLLKKYSPDTLKNLGLEYRYITEYLEGAYTLLEFTKILKEKIWQYAKRQLTWWKRDDKIQWFDIGEKDFRKEASLLVKNFLGQ